jgi:hypothetical protein
MMMTLVTMALCRLEWRLRNELGSGIKYLSELARMRLFQLAVLEYGR